MKFKGHFLLGCVFVFAFYLFLLVIDAKNTPYLTSFKYGLHLLPIANIPLAVVAISAGLYGSILPDIDTIKSKIFVLIFSFLLIVGGYSFCVGLQTIFCLIIILILFQIFLVILGHRKLTHKFSFALIYSLLVGIIFFDFYVALFAFVGYCSHLVGDKITGKK